MFLFALNPHKYSSVVMFSSHYNLVFCWR
uniref:Uncharacterized protein n=1 Tax=Anguilla anguilla TaxID=7936 RepID=A0A0E9V286_ANGAN